MFHQFFPLLLLINFTMVDGSHICVKGICLYICDILITRNHTRKNSTNFDSKKKYIMHPISNISREFDNQKKINSIFLRFFSTFLNFPVFWSSSSYLLSHASSKMYISDMNVIFIVIPNQLSIYHVYYYYFFSPDLLYFIWNWRHNCHQFLCALKYFRRFSLNAFLLKPWWDFNVWTG